MGVIVVSDLSFLESFIEHSCIQMQTWLSLSITQNLFSVGCDRNCTTSMPVKTYSGHWSSQLCTLWLLLPWYIRSLVRYCLKPCSLAVCLIASGFPGNGLVMFLFSMLMVLFLFCYCSSLYFWSVLGSVWMIFGSPVVLLLSQRLAVVCAIAVL